MGRNQDYRQRYGIVTELYDQAKGTDDTEFALLTARTLIDHQGVITVDNVLKSWEDYILAQGGVFDRGGRPLYGAVANLRRGIKPPLSGRDNVMNIDDGAAMRIAPIGIINPGDPQRAADVAEIEAQISHYADGIWAAKAVAASVAVAMVNGSTEEIVQAGLEQIPVDSWLGRTMRQAMKLCEENDHIIDAWANLHTDFWTPSHSVSPEAIPQIYAIFRFTNGDFRKGLFWAANFGRDADTIAAVIGALCGAKHGRSSIPETWVDKVRRPAGVCLKFTADEDILLIGRQLADLIV
jgi:ADP-ribosylglycohydrolase